MSANPPKISLPQVTDEHPIFGKVIYSYTRAQALLDGFQVDVTTTAQEAGVTFPVFLTRPVWEAYVKVPEGVNMQDERGRLWDVVWMFACQVRQKRGQGTGSLFLYRLYVRNTNGAARLVTLKAKCGPLDATDPQPAITIMLPEED